LLYRITKEVSEGVSVIKRERQSGERGNSKEVCFFGEREGIWNAQSFEPVIIQGTSLEVNVSHQNGTSIFSIVKQYTNSVGSCPGAKTSK